MSDKNYKKMPKIHLSFFKCLAVLLIPILAEAIFIGVLILNFNIFWLIALCGLHSFGILTAIEILGKKNYSPLAKQSWIFFALTLSPAGFFLYIFFGNIYIGKNKLKQLKKIDARCDFNIQKFDGASDFSKNNCKLISSTTGYYHYENSKAEYFSSGESIFEDIKKEINNAGEFIFIETHSVESGELLNELIGLLLKKSAEGVDVRLVFDNTMSRFKFKKADRKRLENGGIKLAPFKNTSPLTLINSRDHRKIVSIDGNLSYCLCCNIGDEYVNLKSPKGYWKDGGLKVKGAASDNLTFMFIKMWDSICETETDYQNFIGNAIDSDPSDETILPFCESIFNLSNPFKALALSLIHNARNVLTIVSPFYVLEEELITALMSASAKGVEIRLALPSVSTKSTAHALSLAAVEQLVRGGIKVYSYTPGMIHSKIIVADSKHGTIGSFNLNHRSFYLDYECGVYLSSSPALIEIERDFTENIAKKSRLLIPGDLQISSFQRFAVTLVSLFSSFF